ncbi:MAG: hypothetical protein ACRC9M_08400 [Aeromonas sp.]
MSLGAALSLAKGGAARLTAPIFTIALANSLGCAPCSTLCPTLSHYLPHSLQHGLQHGLQHSL